MPQFENRNMKDNLTERESKIADLFLEFLLAYEKNYVVKGIVYHFFDKQNISKERTFFICKFLERKSLVSLNLNSESEMRNLNFDKLKIQDFLKNNEINKIWRTESKISNDYTLSKWQVKSFWIALSFGLLGGIYSTVEIIKSLTIKEDVKEKPVSKEEMELELSKLRTLILNQKRDTLLTPSNSEKGK